MGPTRSSERAKQTPHAKDRGRPRTSRYGLREAAHFIAHALLASTPLLACLILLFGAILIYILESKDSFLSCSPKPPFPTFSLLTLAVAATTTLAAHIPFIQSAAAPLCHQTERQFRFSCSGGTLILAAGAAFILSMSSGRQTLIDNNCLHSDDDRNLLFASTLLLLVGTGLSLFSPLTSSSILTYMLPMALRIKARRLTDIDPLLAAPTSLDMRRWSIHEVRTVKILAASLNDDPLTEIKTTLRYALPIATTITLGFWSRDSGFELFAEHQARIIDWSLRDTLWTKAIMTLGSLASVIIFLILNLRAQIRRWLRTTGQILEFSPPKPTSSTLMARRAPVRISRRLQHNTPTSHHRPPRRNSETHW